MTKEKKRQTDEQQFTKHSIETQRLSKTNPTETRGTISYAPNGYADPDSYSTILALLIL